MKKIIITLIVTAALIVGAAGCNKNKPDNIGTEMVGQWELTGAEFATRSITVGDEVLTVYIDFQEGGTFRLYQQLGEGRFAYFNGTWAVAAAAYRSGEKLTNEWDTWSVADTPTTPRGPRNIV